MESILVTNLNGKNPQLMRHVVICTRLDRHLGQSGDVYL